MEDRIKALKNLVAFVSEHERVKKSWLGLSKHEVSSFEEILCQFFDDLDIEDIIEASPSPNFLPKASQVELLKKLRDYLEVSSTKFREDDSPEVILKSKEWNAVEKTALQLRNSLI